MIRALAAAAAVAAVGWAGEYREGPLPAHTGGFGEPTCATCHFGSPVNPPEGALELDAPVAVAAGERYTLVVSLRHPELAVAGFQLAVRTPNGEQAGTLDVTSPRTAVTVDTISGIQYAHQTLEGAIPEAHGRARWEVGWIPPPGGGDVVLNVAANAANDDASEFGDYVFHRTLRIPGSP